MREPKEGVTMSHASQAPFHGDAVRGARKPAPPPWGQFADGNCGRSSFRMSQKYLSEAAKVSFWVPWGTFFGSLFGCAEALLVFSLERSVPKNFLPFLGCHEFPLLARAELGPPSHA